MLDTLVNEREESAGPLMSEELSAGTAPQAVPAGELALWVVLATVAMLFAGFTSAYLVRRSAGDWVPIYSPPILWVNTGVILISSVGLEMTKGAWRARSFEKGRIWLLVSAALGAAFVAGQVFAWKQLAASGVFLPTSPHSSFFYMLTGVHAVHVLGGLAALLFVVRHAWDAQSALSSTALVKHIATYWHFVTGVWLFLYVLLFIWR